MVDQITLADSTFVDDLMQSLDIVMWPLFVVAVIVVAIRKLSAPTDESDPPDKDTET